MNTAFWLESLKEQDYLGWRIILKKDPKIRHYWQVNACYLISLKYRNAFYLGSFCQYNHEGMKLRDPRDVSGPSRTPSETCVFSTVALSVATACVCVRPIRLVPFTFSKISPFCNHTFNILSDSSINNLKTFCFSPVK